ncbi:DUF6036 family nucleotidyltransferase [Fuchsiella alkaliacetigena]|uniref:DUF6036 family nucleotidyltransferase n=1 Tax=Fuchsiella alkaliacetigena TaxID=957042 RepID=UPI00200A5715|nr:DUF6036 family nucleotidyltransferase [Fuchsiella alkaliacetigena]MCK8825359.1 DUF6036 family nucleotidyltransferase [Fuchsiella alkaliacetigena]
MNNEVLLDKEKIIKEFIVLDRKVSKEFLSRKRKFQIVIVGGAAFLLKHNLNRTTNDIDSLKLEYELKKYISENSDLFHINDNCYNIMLKHPDYEDRLVKMNINYDFKMLKIYVMSDYDLIIAKFGRGHREDINDILKSEILDSIDQDELDRLMNTAIDFSPVNPEDIRSRWENFKKNYF